MKRSVKKTVLISIMFSFLWLAPHAFAATSDFVALAPIPGLTQGVVANSSGLASFFNNLYKYLIGLAAVLAVIMIIWGGLEISTKDSVSKKQDGKERITQAILGLVLVLSPVLVFSIINPRILNLSIGLSPLTLPTPAPASGGAPAAQTPPVPPPVPSGATTIGLYPCAGNNCSAAERACSQNPQRSAGPSTYAIPVPSVVCVRSDGTVDPNGRTDSRFNPFSDFGCIAGETLSVNCYYVTP